MIINLDDRIPDEIGAFCITLVDRLNHGINSYGNKSFQLPASKAFAEVGMEAIDIPGWASIGFRKLSEMLMKCNDPDIQARIVQLQVELMDLSEKAARAWMHIKVMQNGVDVIERRISSSA